MYTVQYNVHISEIWETSFKNPSKRVASVWGLVRCHQHTDFFAPAHPSAGKKNTSLVNFKHKTTISANYMMDGIGTKYTSYDKEIYLHCKRLKNNFKINQSNQTCTNVLYKGMGECSGFFPLRQVINQVRTRSEASRQGSFHFPAKNSN